MSELETQPGGEGATLANAEMEAAVEALAETNDEPGPTASGPRRRRTPAAAAAPAPAAAEAPAPAAAGGEASVAAGGEASAAAGSEASVQGRPTREVRRRNVGAARAEAIDVRRGSIGLADAASIEVRRGSIGRADADSIEVAQGAIGSARGERISLRQGACGMALGSEVHLEQSATRFVAARETVSLQMSGAWNVLADKVEVGPGSGVVFLVARRVEGDVRPLFDWRGALAFGAAAGLVGALIRRRRG